MNYPDIDTTPRMVPPPKKKLFKRLIDRAYLAASDCDGMCGHCPEQLKVRCNERKNSK